MNLRSLLFQSPRAERFGVRQSSAAFPPASKLRQSCDLAAAATRWRNAALFTTLWLVAMFAAVSLGLETVSPFAALFVSGIALFETTLWIIRDRQARDLFLLATQDARDHRFSTTLSK